MLGLIENNKLLQDTLYGGLAGELYQPDVTQDSPVSDHPKQSLPDLPISDIENYEIIPPEEIVAAALDEGGNFDIRPRVFDNVTKTFSLVDTGSQCSVIRPVQGDALAPHLHLEAVDGSELPCYGKKQHSVRFNRKTYHIEAVVSKTTDQILGMDFIKKYQLDLQWGPFGDYYLVDKKSKIKTLCQFVKVPKHSSPSISAIKVLPQTSAINIADPSPEELVLQACAAQVINDLGEPEIPKTIPLPY